MSRFPNDGPIGGSKRAPAVRRVFVQQLGRGLRLRPGKDKVVVLDFVTDLRRVAEVIELDRASGWTLEPVRSYGEAEMALAPMSAKRSHAVTQPFSLFAGGDICPAGG